MADKLKVGIIGIGAIGNVHAKAYRATGQAEITAICDVNAEHLASECDRLGVAGGFVDYADLLKSDVEAVSVCVGNALHKEVAVAALQAGKHVLLEKPMAMNAGEAQDIQTVAEKSPGILQIGMCNRQRAAAQVLRDYIEKGYLGEIYHMRAIFIRRRGIPGLGGWFTTKAQSGGGPLIDLGVHYFDLAMWLSGQWNPTKVSAKTYAKFGMNMKEYKYVYMWAGPPKFDGTFDVEDYAAGFVRFFDKATLSFEISWASNRDDKSYVEILGDKGGARLSSGPLTIYTEHNGRLTDISPQFDTKVNNYEVQAAKFIEACRGEREPVATGAQGVTVMKLIDAIYASSQADAEVEIAD